LDNIPRLYYNLKNLLTLITKKSSKYASYNLSLVNAAWARLDIFKEYYSCIKANNIYCIIYILDPKVKIK
jgi:hypothetical protein